MKSLRTIGFIGASLAIVGSFLPWEQEGDFISYWMYGIRLFPLVSDNGGVFVILLTLIIVLLAFRPPKYIKNPSLWNLVISVFLMAVSLLFITRWLVHRIGSAGVGAPTLEIGLIGVAAGSALLLWMAIIKYRQVRIYAVKDSS